jgi:HPt (histidine-containing phosphotransfer) domain-containing protein
MMPGMDGIEAAKWIRSIDTEYAKKVPIIALTANAVAGNERLFLDEGFQAFVSKPINVSKLDAVINQWIAAGEPSAAICPAGGGCAEISPGQPAAVNIPGVNAKLGLSLYEGDMEMYIDILRSYAENTPAEIEKLRGLAEETLADYAIDIHTMKGVNSAIGAKEMMMRAKKMEAMAKGGDFTGVLELNADFIKDSETLAENVRAWLEK